MQNTHVYCVRNTHSWVVWVKLACGPVFSALYDQAFIGYYSRKDAAMLSLAFTVALRKTTGYEKRHRKQVTVVWESSDWCFLNNQLNWINFKIKYAVKESLRNFEVWKISNTTDWHSTVEVKFTYRNERDDENSLSYSRIQTNGFLYLPPEWCSSSLYQQGLTSQTLSLYHPLSSSVLSFILDVWQH